MKTKKNLEKAYKGLLVLSVLGCIGLAVAGKVFRVTVTKDGAEGFFSVHVNTYATSIRAAARYTNIHGIYPTTLEDFKRVLPNYELPPRWEFRKDGLIGYERNPYTNLICKDTPNSLPNLPANKNTTCKDGQLVVILEKAK